MEVSLLYVSVVIAIFAYLYRWITKNNDYFHDKPIPSLAVRPLFGASASLLLKKVSFLDFIQNAYNKFPNAKVFGMFETTTPFFVVRDPELIKQLAIKDFDFFMDHRPLFGKSEDNHNPHALFSQAMFSMNGQRWKDIRATLSPAFTGSKMRHMFTLLTKCCDNTVRHYENKMGTRGSVEVELKDMLGRIATDVIATCAFGLQVDSFKDVNNEFYQHGRKLMQFGRLYVQVKMILVRLFPKLASRYGLDLIDQEQAIYFTKVIKDTVASRQSQGIVRNDMIDLLLEARKGVLRHQPEKETDDGLATSQEADQPKIQVIKAISETEMIAQCVVFFLGGFDTVSTSAMFSVYELVRNPEVQEKLYQEILQVQKTLEGKPLTYEALQGMKYMDMVVSEAMRMWPPGPATDRLCVRDYPFDDGQGLKFTIDKGTCLWFPVYGLHMDPKYYPEPTKFIPERFSDENKANINLGTYLPFGIGPRNCIGSRFALMEIKAVLYHLLEKFSIHACADTPIPMKIRKGFNNLAPESGTLNVEFRKRTRV